MLWFDDGIGTLLGTGLTRHCRGPPHIYLPLSVCLAEEAQSGIPVLLSRTWRFRVCGSFSAQGRVLLASGWAAC
jgi:hypothetical protein